MSNVAINIFNDKDSEAKKKLRDELFKREQDARDIEDLQEAQFLRCVRHAVEKGIYMEHNPNGTMYICPKCQQPMLHEHNVYCHYCGQLVK